MNLYKFYILLAGESKRNNHKGGPCSFKATTVFPIALPVDAKGGTL